MYVESSLNPTRHNLPDDAQQSPDFEAVICNLHTTRCTLPILAVYRSPSASKDDHARLFRAMDVVSKCHTECIIVGDFNAPHIDWDSIMPLQPNSFEAELIDVVDDLMLHQHVSTPTCIRIGQNASMLDLHLTKTPSSRGPYPRLQHLPRTP